LRFLGLKVKGSRIGSLYIHIPFCRSKCPYCDFYSVPQDDPDIYERYLNALMRELSAWKEFVDISAVETVYIGGGTPTALNPPLFEGFFKKLADILECKPAEFTVEANPESVTEEKVNAMKEAGVNRISLGVQSLDDDALRFLGRIHGSEEALKAVELIRKASVSLNVDIIYGIPGQPFESLLETAEGVVRINPESASFYALTVKGNRFRGRMLKSDDEIYQEYEAVCRALSASGYEHYEVSNWARKGFCCIHNMNYWERKPYLGLGPSAASLLDPFRFRYIPDVKDFLSENPSLYLEELSREQILLEELYLTLRTNRGLIFERFLDEGLITAKEKMEELVVSGYAFMSEDRFFLTEKGLFLADAIVRYLIQ
jgi:oxygen-independent coproporphyrinogen-3 oxidase